MVVRRKEWRDSVARKRLPPPAPDIVLGPPDDSAPNWVQDPRRPDAGLCHSHRSPRPAALDRKAAPVLGGRKA